MTKENQVKLNSYKL